jgi:hypothetical protein
MTSIANVAKEARAKSTKVVLSSLLGHALRKVQDGGAVLRKNLMSYAINSRQSFVATSRGSISIGHKDFVGLVVVLRMHPMDVTTTALARNHVPVTSAGQ